MNLPWILLVSVVLIGFVGCFAYVMWCAVRLVLSRPSRSPRTAPDSLLEIVHYPITGFYFARVDGQLLKKSYLTGFVTRQEPYLESYATECRTVGDAQRLIDLWLEQQKKVNVEVMPAAGPHHVKEY